MPKQRTRIPDDLAARVLFASDRTCCVCRREQKVILHHIDKDPANNAFENLATMCLNCHSEAHASETLVRPLTPELIRQYNADWRRLVQLRLRTPPGPHGELELVSEALLAAAQDCHGWKVYWMRLACSSLTLSVEREPGDVWDAMLAQWIPAYTIESYDRFAPLFSDGLWIVHGRIDRLLHVFQNVLPSDFRCQLVRAQRQLDTEAHAYAALPSLIAHGTFADEATHGFFRSRFEGVIRVLRGVAREADRKRSLLLEHNALA
jgi:hypothetical protein